MPRSSSGARADGVGSGAVGGDGGTFRLWAKHSGSPLPLEAKTKLVHPGSSLVSVMRFGEWNHRRPLAAPPPACSGLRQLVDRRPAVTESNPSVEVESYSHDPELAADTNRSADPGSLPR